MKRKINVKDFKTVRHRSRHKHKHRHKKRKIKKKKESSSETVCSLAFIIFEKDDLFPRIVIEINPNNEQWPTCGRNITELERISITVTEY